MLFNSYQFIFVFLPITLIVYFILNRRKLIIAAKIWMILASLFFYGYWNVRYIPILLFSIIANFFIGLRLNKYHSENKNRISKKFILISGIIFNISLLGYFKYANFFIKNFDFAFNRKIELLHVVLPLGISFFTFTQITYLVDSYKGKARNYNLLNYLIFVTFFPHLIAGPILHHKDIIPQLSKIRNLVLNYRNIATGLFIFGIGLFKKVIFADTFAVWANSGCVC